MPESRGAAAEVWTRCSVLTRQIPPEEAGVFPENAGHVAGTRGMVKCAEIDASAAIGGGDSAARHDRGFDMLNSIEGVFRDGSVELLEPVPPNAGGRVIVALLSPTGVDLRQRGINEDQAADLRRRLAPFAEDWDRP